MEETPNPLYVSDVFRLAGVNAPVGVADRQVSVLCPGCDNERPLDTCLIVEAEGIGQITEYRCRRCDIAVATTGHWGLLPPGTTNYRLGLYAIALAGNAYLDVGSPKRVLLPVSQK